MLQRKKGTFAFLSKTSKLEALEGLFCPRGLIIGLLKIVNAGSL